MNTLRTTLVLLAVTLLTAAPAQAQLYVDANASGANDGSSWSDAYTSLQDALAAATGSDEIWIAEGTYIPGANASDTFFIDGDQDGLEIYGGFAGDETSRSQRSPEDHRTVLSGDIDGDDNTNAHGVTETADDINGANIHTVFHLDFGITSATVIDGVTITGGQSLGDGFDRFGGGIFLESSGPSNPCNPTISNVIFAGNTAFEGGAIHVRTAAQPHHYEFHLHRQQCSRRRGQYSRRRGGEHFY